MAETASDLVRDFEKDEEMGEPLLEEYREVQAEVSLEDHGGRDVVQFAADTYYADEGETLKVDIIRLGNLEGRAATSFFTQDVTAQHYVQYLGVRGQCVFEPGEHTKTIDIKVLDDEMWSATKVFQIILQNPQNCQLAPRMSKVLVKILNYETFPSSEYQQDVKASRNLSETVKTFENWSLFFEYCKLVYWSGNVAWQSAFVVVIDQLAGIFLFITLWVGVYIVDVIFERGGQTRRELLLPNRYQTAAVVALWYVIPNVVLFIWEVIKVHMDIKGEARKYLQASLMRTYLEYTNDSRELVTNADVNVAMTSSAEEVSSAYCAFLSLFGICGRIIALEVFIIYFQPESLATRLIIWMVVFLVFLTICRVGFAQEAQERVEARLTLLETLTDESCRKYRLFQDYSRRGLMGEMFERASAEYNKEAVVDTLIHLSTQYSTKLISGFFIAYYIIQRTEAVLAGTLSLGIFLAVITIFATYLADAITELNSQLMVIVDAFVPLKEFTFFFNLPLELKERKQITYYRRDQTARLRARMWQENKRVDHSDLIPLTFTNVSFQYSSTACVFDSINITIQQGQLVAVTGPHNSGKATLIDLVTGAKLPTSGELYVPSHLHVLNVSRQAIFLHASMLHNLVLGLPDSSRMDKARIIGILRLLELPSMISVVENEISMEADCGNLGTGRAWIEDEINFMGSDEPTWEQSLTNSSKVKLHIARALIANPEVIVFERTLQGLNEETTTLVFDVISRHVKERGLCLPDSERRFRRPRTVIFTTDHASRAAKADCILEMDEKTNSITQRSNQRPLASLSTMFTPRQRSENEVGCMSGAMSR